MTQPSAASRYHHGDLRTTLLRAAETHIALEGTERLSLRALAREAGVSATAPYRHFDDRQALLVALATEGFEELAVVNADIHRNFGHEPIPTQLLQCGLAYVRYAEANQVKYLLMFGDVVGDFSPYPELVDASERAFAPLAALLRSGLDSGLIVPLDFHTLAGVTWASVHGVASLLLKGARGSEGLAAQRAEPRRAIAALGRHREAALAQMFAGFFQCPQARTMLEQIASQNA
jgi:AcrR family transcriptional regulator